MDTTEEIAMAMAQRIQEQLERQTFHDVIVVVKERTFECHRFLLSASSEFFRAMFSSGMTENFTRKVIINSIDPEIFSLILDCVYKANYVLNEDNIIDIWHASNMLQIDFLIKSCERFLNNHLSVDNSVEIYLHAKLLDSQTLMKLSWDLIVTKFHHTGKTEDVMMLDYNDMLKLVADDDLITPSEDLVVEVILRWATFISEEATVLAGGGQKPFITTDRLPQASNETQENQISAHPEIEEKNQKLKTDPGTVVKTTSKDTVSVEESLKRKHINGREEKLFSLLSVARICLMSSSYTLALTENKLVRKNPKAYALVMEGLRYQLQPGRRHDYCPPYAMHRSSSEFRNVIIAVIRQEKQTKMSCRTTDGMWFQLAPLPHQLINCAAVTYDNDIYVTGSSNIHPGYLNRLTDADTSKLQHGMKHKNELSKKAVTEYKEQTQNFTKETNIAESVSMYTFKYHSTTNTWKQLNALSAERYNHALVSLNGYIYAIGGDNCFVVERFSASDEQRATGTGKWEVVGILMHDVSNIITTIFEDNIVVFGNVGVRNPYPLIQCFNTQTMSAHTIQETMSGSIKNMVTFKHKNATYLLQETGALWKLTACDKDNFSVKLKCTIWGFPVDISAATVYNRELLVLAGNIPPLMPREWSTSHSPVKHVKIIEREAIYFLNNVIPKSFLTVREGENVQS